VTDGTGCFWATWRVLEELHEQGKIRALCVSNLPLAVLRRMWPEQGGAVPLVRVPPHAYQGYLCTVRESNSTPWDLCTHRLVA
jgi:hypothetical protein